VSIKRRAARFLCETLVGNVLSSAGDKIGEAIGEVIGRRINPQPIPKDDDEKKDGEKKDGAE